MHISLAPPEQLLLDALTTELLPAGIAVASAPLSYAKYARSIQQGSDNFQKLGNRLLVRLTSTPHRQLAKCILISGYLRVAQGTSVPNPNQSLCKASFHP